jgi:hypothetical protein
MLKQSIQEGKMRKNPRFLVALLLLSSLSALTVVYLAGCGGTKPPEDSWTYVGTWVNPAYNGHPGVTAGKMVVTATLVTMYNNDTDTTPAGDSIPIAVAADWTSGGAHYFKHILDVAPNTSFGLTRVSNNNTLEGNSSSTAFPASIDPAAPDYRIYTRQ